MRRKRTRTEYTLAVVRAASKIIDREGASGLSMTNVARLAEIHPETMRHYFASPAEIYVATVAHVIGKWEGPLKAVTRDSEPYEALAKFAADTRSYLKDNAHDVRVFIREVVIGQSARKIRYKRRMVKRFEEWSATVESWIARKLIDNVDPRKLLIELWAKMGAVEMEPLAELVMDARVSNNEPRIDPSATLHLALSGNFGAEARTVRVSKPAITSTDQKVKIPDLEKAPSPPATAGFSVEDLKATYALAPAYGRAPYWRIGMKEDRQARPSQLTELSAMVVSAHASRNEMTAEELLRLMRDVHRTLKALNENLEPPPAHGGSPKPAVEIQKSVSDAAIFCLEDGLPFKSLRRHLASTHQMTPYVYRKRWNLPDDYPMVAPAYSARRSVLAKSAGLGKTVVRPKKQDPTT